jgi:hypothetical protein
MFFSFLKNDVNNKTQKSRESQLKVVFTQSIKSQISSVHEMKLLSNVSKYNSLNNF